MRDKRGLNCSFQSNCAAISFMIKYQIMKREKDCILCTIIFIIYLSTKENKILLCQTMCYLFTQYFIGIK